MSDDVEIMSTNNCQPDSLSALLRNENGFSVSVLKKRRRLIEVLRTKRLQEIVIHPHKKVFKGDNVNNFRGSKYRGISKNGNSWQILLMVNRKKKYLGTLNSEELAAKFYDKVAIQYQGVKAKTNFLYNKLQIIEILKLQPLLSEVDFGLGPCQQADSFGDDIEL